MSSDFVLRLRALAGVVVRVGLNLQPGQPLLITDPYELQGVHPEALPLAEAVHETAGKDVVVLTADPARLRTLADANDRSGFAALVAGHTARLRQHLARGGAFLFLTGSHPGLFGGLPPERLNQFDRIKWQHLGPVIQKLIRGASQWTLVPAPATPWADAAFPDLSDDARLPALWSTVFESMRVGPANSSPTGDPVAAWQLHLAALARRRDELNAARHRIIRYSGRDTDLRFALPRSHQWCTAQLTTSRDVPFVVNLPTEEIFTAPHQHSAEGRVRVARSVIHAGGLIENITLEFVRGRVVTGHATYGNDLLQHLLRTDSGACRIGEVAIVPHASGWASVSQPQRRPRDWSRVRSSEQQDPPTPIAGVETGDHTARRLFHHTILDENACNHIALGDAYRFCSKAWLPLALNSSQVHVDLPLDANVELF